MSHPVHNPAIILKTWSSAITDFRLASSSCLVPVGSVDFGVNGAIVVSNGVDSIVCLWHDSGWRSGSCTLSPHQGLQLAKLLPDVGVGWWDGLGDGGVPVGHTGLRGGAEVSITWINAFEWRYKMNQFTFQSADIVAPEPCLLGEGNVAGVEIQRHFAE